MIPKRGKDRSKFKPWRPIALAKCVDKVGEKLMADRFQKATRLFHELRYGSRKAGSATDAMMITVPKAKGGAQRGNYVTVLRKDIVSVPNNVLQQKLIGILKENELQNLRTFCPRFLELGRSVSHGFSRPRKINHGLWDSPREPRNLTNIHADNLKWVEPRVKDIARSPLTLQKEPPTNGLSESRGNLCEHRKLYSIRRGNATRPGYATKQL